MSQLVVAAAGSGKTTYICRCALDYKQRVLVVTYTDENEECIKDKLYKLNGCIPEHVEVLSWFSFLLKHGVRPYQAKLFDSEIKGMILVNEKSGKKYQRSNGIPVYYAETDIQNHYFNRRNRIYSDKIAKFAVKCIDLTDNLLLKRMSSIYGHIFIDEAQDLAGYDLEFIKRLMAFGIPITMVADPRQTTYKTHYDDLYKKYANGNLQSFCRDECDNVSIDLDTLAVSYRNSVDCVELSSALFPEYPKPVAGNTNTESPNGVFFINEDSAEMYIDRYEAMQLRPRKDTKGVVEHRNVMNIGRSKGREFDSILIFPTKDMVAWISDHQLPLQPKTRAQLYVALTRARFRVAIYMPRKDFSRMVGIEVVDGLSIKKIQT
jgi:DNA helicase-2/ATP-dependent DNA helicase PcrA